jgi:ribose 5-phosphate isomerase B
VINESRVKQMVRRVVYRTLGLPQSGTRGTSRPIVTEADIQAVPPGGEFQVPPGALITPLARQVAMDRHVVLAPSPSTTAADHPGVWEGPSNPGSGQVIAVGADHAGYPLKQELSRYLSELGFKVQDCGTGSADSVDYPDFAVAVAQLVASGRAWRGIMVDGAGIGSCMVANKIPGVRAAMCYDQATAVNSREHNDANVLTLGAGLIGPALARQIVQAWLQTNFGGGRHARRVNKIVEIDRRYRRTG